MKRKKNSHALAVIICLEVVLALSGLALILLIRLADGDTGEIKQQSEAETAGLSGELDQETEETEAEIYAVPSPEISEQLLTLNEWSRPGIKIRSLDYIVVHYLANPGTTAQQNHDYFESLKDLQNESMSANYVIGTEGEIIHCVPDDEIAYATSQANYFSISIENCHLDETGELTEATYDSLVKLVAYLSEQYGLERDQIIRHYDVTGKDCPKYFVENEGTWDAFLDDVMAYCAECLAALQEESETQTTAAAYDDEEESTELAEFLKELAKEDD